MLDAVVLTGGPCVGKSTLIALLAGLGFPVVREKASEVIAEGKALPWVDAEAFRKEVLVRQIDCESAIESQSTSAFLDRGAYDGIAYCLATGVAVHSFLGELVSRRYKLAFVLEGLPAWENDGIRYEDPAFTRLITPILAEVYRDKGAEVVSVPFMTVSERLAFILGRLAGR